MLQAAVRPVPAPVRPYDTLVSSWNAPAPTVALDSTKSGRSVAIWAWAADAVTGSRNTRALRPRLFGRVDEDMAGGFRDNFRVA